MQLTIHDNHMIKVAYLNNDVPDMIHFFNDNWHRYLAEGTSTFDFSVSKRENGELNPTLSLISEKGYISFTYQGKSHLFNIMKIEEDDFMMTLSCENLNLELINEQVNKFSSAKAQNITWYISQMGLLANTQIIVDTNDIPSVTKILTYDSQESKLARLIALITDFEGEFEFVTKLNSDGSLDTILLNIYQVNDGGNIQGVGKNRADVNLYFGKNITGVTRTVDKTQIFNATTVTDSNGKYKWDTLNQSVKASDGSQVEFYKNVNDSTAYAPISMELYPSQVKSDSSDKWIRKDFQIEATSALDLWNYALSQFKRYAYPQVTYQVDAASDLVYESVGNDLPLDIGDTVTIQDENFGEGLILSARVSEMEISFSSPISNKLTFSNFIQLKSQISEALISRMRDMVQENTPYRAELNTTNGVQFKNSIGTTTLSSHIYFGSDAIETVADSYEWFKDGISILLGQTLEVEGSDIRDKAVYSYQAMINGKVVATKEITITNVLDGQDGAQGLKGDTGAQGSSGIDGQTPYLHIAYANSSTGESGFTVTGTGVETYIGQYTDFISIDSTDYTKYTWSLIQGPKGAPTGVTQSSIEPSLPFTGMMWQYTGSSTLSASDETVIQPMTQYVWNGKNWTLLQLDVNNLNVANLGAITADIGTISNTFNYVKNNINFVGHLSISGGEYSITYAIELGDKTSQLVDYEYQFNTTSTSTTVPPMKGWVSEALTFEPNWYGIFFTYSSGAQVASYFPNMDGAQFIGNSTVTYQIGTSGTTIPTGTWSSTRPTVSLTQFLWLKIDFPCSPAATAYVCYYGGIATSGGTISMSPYEGVTTVKYDELERWIDPLYKNTTSNSQISNDGSISSFSSSSSGTNSISIVTAPSWAQILINSSDASNNFTSSSLTSKGVALSTDVSWMDIKLNSGWTATAARGCIKNGVCYLQFSAISHAAATTSGWQAIGTLPSALATAKPSLNVVINGAMYIKPDGTISANTVANTATSQNGLFSFPVGI